MAGVEGAIKKAIYGKRKKIKKDMDIRVDVAPLNDYKPKPHLDVSSEDLPEIKDWKVGETYTIEVNAKMTSISESEYDGKKKTTACFEIQTAEAED